MPVSRSKIEDRKPKFEDLEKLQERALVATILASGMQDDLDRKDSFLTHRESEIPKQ